MANGWKPNTPFEQHVVDRLQGISVFIESIKVDCANRREVLMSHDKRLTLIENDADNIPCKVHDSRIATLERRYLYIAGFCAGICGLIAVLWKLYERMPL